MTEIEIAKIIYVSICAIIVGIEIGYNLRIYEEKDIILEYMRKKNEILQNKK